MLECTHLAPRVLIEDEPVSARWDDELDQKFCATTVAVIVKVSHMPQGGMS